MCALFVPCFCVIMNEQKMYLILLLIKSQWKSMIWYVHLECIRYISKYDYRALYNHDEGHNNAHYSVFTNRIKIDVKLLYALLYCTHACSSYYVSLRTKCTE